jgi:tetratricopeptide (TPR) repeat protein
LIYFSILFCKINKDNEKRKALSLFFVNLCNNKIISEVKKLEVSDPINLDVLNSLTLMSQQQGNISDAIQTREKISKLDPWNAENYFQLVTLYKSIGNIELARINYEKIISFAPNIEIARQSAKIIN